MEQRLSLITLGVKDVARSRKFHENLGWKASGVGDERVTFFQLGGIALALWGKEALAEDAQVRAEGAGFSGIALAHNVRSKAAVDVALRNAIKAGATLLRAALDTEYGGYAGYFADPDGYAWEVAWNPGFQMRDDGSIELPI